MLAASPGRSRRAGLWWDGVRTGTARQGLAVVHPPSPFFPPFPAPEVSIVVPGGLVRLRAQLGVRSGTSLSWPIWQILIEANWGGALAGERTSGGPGQGHWAQCGDQQLLGHPAVLGTVCCHCVSLSLSGYPWKNIALPSAPLLFLLLTLSLQRKSSSLIFAEPWLADLSLSLCLCLCLSLYVL